MLYHGILAMRTTDPGHDPSYPIHWQKLYCIVFNIAMDFALLSMNLTTFNDTSMGQSLLTLAASTTLL